MVFLPYRPLCQRQTDWIALGPISIQSAEVAKFALVVYLAGYLTRNQAALSTDAIALVRPLALVGMLCILLLAQPDFGSVVVLAAVTGGVLFLAGATAIFASLLADRRRRRCFVSDDILVPQPDRLQRMITFLDPRSIRERLSADAGADRVWSWGSVRARSRAAPGIQKLVTAGSAQRLHLRGDRRNTLVGALVVFALLVTIVLRIFRIAGQALEEGLHVRRIHRAHRVRSVSNASSILA